MPLACDWHTPASCFVDSGRAAINISDIFCISLVQPCPKRKPEVSIIDILWNDFILCAAGRSEKSNLRTGNTPYSYGVIVPHGVLHVQAFLSGCRAGIIRPYRFIFFSKSSEVRVFYQVFALVNIFFLLWKFDIINLILQVFKAFRDRLVSDKYPVSRNQNIFIVDIGFKDYHSIIIYDPNGARLDVGSVEI